MIRTFIVAALLAGACGGKDKAAPATPAPTGEMKHGEDGDHHAAMTPELTAFHDLLRPRWHAQPGPQRMADTCSALPQFQSAADALAKAVPPQTANADTWTAGTRGIVAAAGDLDAACKTNDVAPFDAAFGKLHDAFHGLMMAAGEHGKGGGGTDGGGQHGSEHHGGHAH